MKVSRNWLNDFVEVNDMNELADLFSLHSQEVESVYSLTDATNLVVGYVKEKEAHPDAKKLSVCKVDVGSEELQIVCGAPNVDKGQKVIVALVGAVLQGEFEIKDAVIRGVASSGMICSLTELGIDKKYANADGIEVLPEDAPIGEDPLEYLELRTDVLELDLTPNRADLLSMRGVAYDTAAFYRKDVSLPYISIEEIAEENPMEVELATDNCMSYYTRVIKDVEIKESPNWLKARLIAAGMRPINNVVDITNYVMLEMGQPLHAFDLELFGSQKVVVRMANEGENLITLDEKERRLDPSDIVITNGEKSTALGGVMGGYDSEICDDTKYVLLEAATFNQTCIRKTSRRLDLRSDASQRFEKGVDPNGTLLALNRATQLFQQLAGGKVLSGIKYVENQDLSDKEIDLTVDYINGTLGKALEKTEITEILEALSFEVTSKDDTLTVSVPTRRRDIETKQDLIEEVVRIYGYNNIPNTLPKTITTGALTHEQVMKRRLRKTMNSLGIDEAITYSLINEKDVYKYTLEEKEYTKLLMPMSEDKAVLRHSLLNGLIPALSYNAARKLTDVALYEIGHVYKDDEPNSLACVITGDDNLSTWSNTAVKRDFYYIKGVLEQALNIYGVSGTYRPKELKEAFHPGQSAEVLVDGEVIGFIAKLHPKFEKELDLSDTYVFEISLSKLSKEREFKVFNEMLKYPTVERDIAMVVSRDILVQDLIDCINDAATDLLIDAKVFDRYVGENVNDDEQSIAMKLLFNDPTKTLESDEVKKEIDKIVIALADKFSAKLRD